MLHVPDLAELDCSGAFLFPDQAGEQNAGYREVAVEEKAGLVREVFRSVAGNYDLMNDLMSLGVHRAWKQDFAARSGVLPGDYVLDLAGGTGDIAALLSKRVGARGKVLLTDINEAMLEVGRQRLEDRGIVGNVAFALVDAEHLPFGDGVPRVTKRLFHSVPLNDADALEDLIRQYRDKVGAFLIEPMMGNCCSITATREYMRAVRELTVGLVHELNNVLGVIIGNTHLAQKEPTDVAGVEK